MTVDLTPAARHLAELLTGVADDRLQAPTPCAAYALGDLVDHVDRVSVAFAAAARKEAGSPPDGGLAGDGARLDGRFRSRTMRHLADVAEAWRPAAAWAGVTRVDGVELAAETAGELALVELVIHGWDVARATGQTYAPDTASLEAVHRVLLQPRHGEPEWSRSDGFGPVFAISADAPLLDRVVALAGRDTSWSPAPVG
ncbi:MAG: TIGR03086 family protein [Actinobacteria bacterium]|nr:TIGR03086 family protein [Actinomycetota bacterium]